MPVRTITKYIEQLSSVTADNYEKSSTYDFHFPQSFMLANHKHNLYYPK